MHARRVVNVFATLIATPIHRDAFACKSCNSEAMERPHLEFHRLPPLHQLPWIHTVCYNGFKHEICKQRMLTVHDSGWSWQLARLGITAYPLQIFRMYSILLVSRNVDHLLALGRNRVLELKCSHARTCLLGSLVGCMYKVLKPGTCIVSSVAILHLTALFFPLTFPPNNRSALAFLPIFTLSWRYL